MPWFWTKIPPQPLLPREEVLLGTGDIQSLADLGNSFSFIENMGPLLGSDFYLRIATLRSDTDSRTGSQRQEEISSESSNPVFSP
jgi:hypothetical protein